MVIWLNPLPLQLSTWFMDDPLDVCLKNDNWKLSIVSKQIAYTNTSRKCIRNRALDLEFGLYGVLQKHFMIWVYEVSHHMPQHFENFEVYNASPSKKGF